MRLRLPLYGPFDASFFHMFLGKTDEAIATARHLRAIALAYSRGLQRAVIVSGQCGDGAEPKSVLEEKAYRPSVTRRKESDGPRPVHLP